ncbi:MAG: non-homologous end-joining DNA ligase [Candidatus Dependentiae bacterium]|nr:non-homologous end-joining DNA ligase [Candidatus Dependentiae bacterium]
MRYGHSTRVVHTILTIAALLSTTGDTMSKSKLSGYRARRNFSKTDEPSGVAKKREKHGSVFVVQRHDASHLHYDIRLENNGVLTSFAVPKGIPRVAGIKHLAVQTEDHPLEYADFEGTIPAGEYGAGTVEIWDRGTFTNVSKGRRHGLISIDSGLRMGRVKVILKGEKLNGEYVFLRMKKVGKRDWLLFKMAHATTLPDRTITLNRHKIDLTHEDKLLFPEVGVTKRDLIEYYRKIAPWMLRYTRDRFVAMLRMPDGMGGESFYQKNMPDNYPDWISSVTFSRKEDGRIRMVVIDNAATLVYLANQYCITPHVGLCRIDKTDAPDRLIFDFDPSKKNTFAQICTTALSLKKIFESVGLVPFVMTTGSRGLHVVVPLRRDSTFDEARAFCREIAKLLEATDPKHLTTEIRKKERHGRIYIDISRIAYAQTSVAPYAVRTRAVASVATPLGWDELNNKRLTSQSYTIKNIFARLKKRGDPWKNMARSARSLKKAWRTLTKMTSGKE